MNRENKFKQYVQDKFDSELSKYTIYVNDDLGSLWWINPNTKEWIFEFKFSSHYCFYYEKWKDKFKSSLCLEEDEFISLIYDYIQKILKRNINQLESADWKFDNIINETLQFEIICFRPSDETLQFNKIRFSSAVGVLGETIEHTINKNHYYDTTGKI